MNATDRTHYEADRLIRLYELPIPTRSEANRSRHEHWAVTRKRAAFQRGLTKSLLWLPLDGTRRSETPVTITLTRISPRRLDTDNLTGALKHVRDGVADALGHPDDSHPRLTWRYAQRRGAKGAYAVEVRVEATNGLAVSA